MSLLNCDNCGWEEWMCECSELGKGILKDRNAVSIKEEDIKTSDESNETLILK
jgi:hypothetical protein